MVTPDLFGFTCPMEYIIRTPVESYAAEPYFDEQIMNTANREVKYWESIMLTREGGHKGKTDGYRLY